ncbi:hypothetical protein QFC24_006320 [Naganishia onofrii]|uniref:Uncharacterized protein n=1 Tax=Naganishia onofrii TaxID=1851511 RepID=A0ACC2X2Q1_9TREE|nr:hypothetical protein QFC24_006320 [Naganishia onofrii]
MSANSQAFTSANRFAALESLNSTPAINGSSSKTNGLPNGKSQSNGSAGHSTTSTGKKSKSKLANGHANAQMNGSADANAGKKPKDRISSSSIESQPSIDVKTTPRAAPTKVDSTEASSTTTRQRASKKKEARGKPSLQADALSLSNLPVGKKVRQVVDTANAKIDWEVPRKTLHASIGFLVLYLYNTQPDSVWPLIRILAATCVVVYLTDLLRFRSQTIASWYNYLLGALMRESEKTTVNGVVWYLIGVTWTLAVYPRDVAVIAIMTLSWSDTAASTVGRLIGRYSSPLPSYVPLIPFLHFAKRKSLAGYLAAALTGFCICLGFWWNGRHEGWQPHAGDAGWWFLDFQGSETGHGFGRINVAGKPLGLWLSALVLGFGGATVEAIDVKLDDNLTLPIGTGALMWAWLTIAKYIL